MVAVLGILNLTTIVLKLEEISLLGLQKGGENNSLRHNLNQKTSRIGLPLSKKFILNYEKFIGEHTYLAS